MRSAQELNSLALKTRRLWNEDGYSPIDIFAIVNGWKDKKITLVSYPMSSRLSGMCAKEGADVVICINSSTSYGRQRFTLAHELYHILYEEGTSRAVCDMTMSSNKTDSEREADLFASYLLMPYDALLQYGEDKKWDLETIIDAEQFFQISHQAMLYRLTLDNMISREDAEIFKGVSVSSTAARLGYSKDLYFPSDKSRQYFTTGEYIRKVEKMAEMDLISNGKREELLMDAYRADIVFDYDEGETAVDD